MQLHQVIAVPQGATTDLWHKKVVATHTDDDRACQQAWELNRGRSEHAPHFHVRTVRGVRLLTALLSIRTRRAPAA